MNPLGIALQGIGFGALLVAVQGFAPATVTTPVDRPRYSTSQAAQAHQRQLREEDEIILSLLQTFVMEI